MRRLGAPRIRVGCVGVAVLVLLLAVGPLSAARGSAPGGGAGTGVAPLLPTSGLSASVTFQGSPTASHDSPSSAIQSSFDTSFTSVFSWSNSQATLITQATLSVQFLGATVGTTSNSLNGAVPQLRGTINLTSDFTQNKYLFEGVYQLVASLFDHGQALYNTTFYVWVAAPYHVTVVNVALVLIGIYEIWQIAALGSVRVARKQLGLDPPPKKGAP